MKRFLRDPLLGWVLAAGLSTAVAAHARTDDPAPPIALSVVDSVAVDSSAVGAAAVDSAGIGSTTPDSAAVDSLGTILPDSLAAGSAADSSAVDSLGYRRPDGADGTETFRLLERDERLRRLQPAAVGSDWLDWRRAETLEGTLESLPTASIRVAGDKGMRSYLALSPVGFRAPEIWVDGIPTRSPGDLDPGIWDRSSIPVDELGSSVDDLGPADGESNVWLRSRAPLDGRTLMVTRFSSAAYETFQRAVSVTTPASNRVVRLDFEDWATNEGYAYSLAPDVLSSSVRGRSAMRRFRLGTDFQIDDARVRFTFGRGRRFHRGDALGTQSTERWTGELGVVVDHFGPSAVNTIAAWHLDFHDDDRILGQEIDASRQGVRWQRRPDGAGWGLDARVERWALQTAAADTATYRADPTRVVRLAAFVQGDPAATVWPWLRLAVVDGEHTSRELGLGGRTGVRWRVGDWSLAAVATRDLRVPTLLETDGWQRFRTVTPAGDDITYVPRVFVWRGSSRLDVEAEQRVALELEGRTAGFDVGAAVERWQLEDGIGWEPDGDAARVVGDREIDAVQVRGNLGRTWRFGRADWRVRVRTQGHFVVAEADPTAGRGVGWPRWQWRTRFGVDRDFFSPRNRLGVDVEAYGRGPARDDGLGPLGAVEVPTTWDVGARVWLRVRDAEMSLNFDNALDRRLDEVAGTFRRPRQLRWQLVWPFFN